MRTPNPFPHQSGSLRCLFASLVRTAHELTRLFERLLETILADRGTRRHINIRTQRNASLSCLPRWIKRNASEANAFCPGVLRGLRVVGRQIRAGERFAGAAP